MGEILTGAELAPRSGAKAKQLIIFLHGVGADGNDLISLGYEMAQSFPDAHFSSPNAPFVFDMAPFGFQWFSLKDYIEQPVDEAFEQAGKFEGARLAAPHLNAFIDAQLAHHGLTEENLALVGFSQGTMMALHVGLRRTVSPACIIGFSGALLGADFLEQEAVSKPPICLIHGEEDPVVPFGLMERAANALSGQGFAVETHPRPLLPHGIDQEGIEIATSFLQKHL